MVKEVGMAALDKFKIDCFYFQEGDLIVLDDLSSTERWEVTGVWEFNWTYKFVRFEIKSMVTGKIDWFESKIWIIGKEDATGYKVVYRDPNAYQLHGKYTGGYFYLVKASDRRWEKSLWDPKELKELQNALNG